MSIGGGGDDEEELEAIQRMQDDKLIMRTPTTTIAVMLYPTNQVSIILHTNIIISKSLKKK